MHGIADVAAADFLVEHQTEPVASFAVLPGGGERVKPRLDVVFLCSKPQTLRYREHADSVCIEGVPRHMFGVVCQRYALVGSVQWGTVQTVTRACKQVHLEPGRQVQPADDEVVRKPTELLLQAIVQPFRFATAIDLQVGGGASQAAGSSTIVATTAARRRLSTTCGIVLLLLLLL